MTRVALVTGAARGIGAATVRKLVSDEYAVVAVDWCAGPDATPYPMPTRADLDLLADVGDVLPVVADVRDREALDVAVAAAAVIAGGQKLRESPPDHLDMMWGVDAKGVWNTASAAVPAMLSRPEPAGCRFVGVASAAGSQGLFHLAGYSAVKHAVVGIVRGLAGDLVGTGVTAAAVRPGSTRTEMLDRTARLYDDASVYDLVSHQLLGRVIEPEEIAETIAFCCSPGGAVLNGSVVHADGGFRG